MTAIIIVTTVEIILVKIRIMKIITVMLTMTILTVSKTTSNVLATNKSHISCRFSKRP